MAKRRRRTRLGTRVRRPDAATIASLGSHKAFVANDVIQGMQIGSKSAFTTSSENASTYIWTFGLLGAGVVIKI